MSGESHKKLVFNTSQTTGYRFPTHSAELIMDRSEAAASEAFLVMLEPGQATPLHVHGDTEQVFYVLSGKGELRTGPEGGRREPAGPADLIRIPAGTHHSVACRGAEALVYLSIDCFLGGRPKDEPTWESHLKVVCEQNGWDFSGIRRDRETGNV